MDGMRSEVVDYIVEEVTRQGHDVTRPDGIERVGWMLDAWTYALHNFGEYRQKPEFDDAMQIGKRVERVHNKDGIRTCGVRVGNRRCPDPSTLHRGLTLLFELGVDTLTPIEFYKQFELIHPFVDGNGRTGKVLLNWMNGTLLHPIFPPRDLFGDTIINP